MQICLNNDVYNYLVILQALQYFSQKRHAHYILIIKTTSKVGLWLLFCNWNYKYIRKTSFDLIMQFNLSVISLCIILFYN